MVQEQGVAVGWPLNLGHDTKGWPLGLRLRLMHEDLQWPRMEELALSSSCISTSDSSSLDTASTRSFFQDKSKSLGALLGFPILDSAGNPVRHQHQQQSQRRRAIRSPSTFRPNTPSSSPVLQTASNAVTLTAKARYRLHGPSSARQQQQHLSNSSTAQGAPSAASSAGWSLLSALSCAHVPAEIGSLVNHEDHEETPIPCAQLVAAEIPSRSFVQDSELDLQESRHHSPGPPTVLFIRDTSHQHLNSFARKLYDNISFEDELEMCNNKQRRSSASGLSSDASSEWNPLFASSPHAARDEDNEEYNDENYNRISGSVTTIRDHFLEQQEACTAAVPLISLLRSSNNNSDGLLYCRKGSRLRIGGGPTSTTFCVDVGKWQQKQKQVLGHGRSRLMNSPTDQDSQFKSQRAQDSLKSRVVSAFIYRTVCCRSTPTRGSSI